MRLILVISCLSIFMSLASSSLAQNLVELRSGSQVQGKVLEIRKEAKEFDIELSIGDKAVKRTYAYDQVEAVTINGKRYVLNSSSAKRVDGETPKVTRAEIERIIEESGNTPPDWYDSAPLNYPQTLDLSWPLKPEGSGWQADKYVFHYLWSNVYPNPNRWQSGAKLIHQILKLHRNDRELLSRDMRELGHMYFRLLQDYPRAAFWYRKSGVEKGTAPSVHLAECYWRLGNKTMAMEELQASSLTLDAVKLYSDMGETERALQLANAFARTGQTAKAYLLAGDICRSAGKQEEAIQYYQKTLQSNAARNAEYLKRFHTRARESIEAIELLQKADPSQVADGSYTATTTGYAGPLEVEVKVASGRIESLRVTKHHEKQFYSSIKDIPLQIQAKQSVVGIDAVSGATITSQAIVNGTAKALASGWR